METFSSEDTGGFRQASVGGRVHLKSVPANSRILSQTTTQHLDRVLRTSTVPPYSCWPPPNKLERESFGEPRCTSSAFSDTLPFFSFHKAGFNHFAPSLNLGIPIGRKYNTVFICQLIPKKRNQSTPLIRRESSYGCKDFFNGCHVRTLPKLQSTARAQISA